jgi:hypothetical protein
VGAKKAHGAAAGIYTTFHPARPPGTINRAAMGRIFQLILKRKILGIFTSPIASRFFTAQQPIKIRKNTIRVKTVPGTVLKSICNGYSINLYKTIGYE